MWFEGVIFMSFGERLKAARKAKGLTQEQLAKIIGVAKSTLTGYEKGNREPDVLKIHALANALDVTGDSLLGIDAPSPAIAAQTDDERQLLRDYRALSDQGKEYVRQTLVIALNTYKKDFFVSDVEDAGEVG